MAIMEISVVPLGLGDASVGDYVAALVRYLQQENIPYELTDMGTLVHGASGQTCCRWPWSCTNFPSNRGSSGW